MGVHFLILPDRNTLCYYRYKIGRITFSLQIANGTCEHPNPRKIVLLFSRRGPKRQRELQQLSDRQTETDLL